MTGLVLASLLACLLVFAATAGPFVLRKAAPSLVKTPRLAAWSLSATTLLWTIAMLALGPLLAWTINGPQLLSGTAGTLCQQCLTASNPFGKVNVDSVVPTSMLIVPPFALSLALIIATVIALENRRRATRILAESIQMGATEINLQGERILCLPDTSLRAFALPKRCGGIVISAGAIDSLSHQQLEAVLAHERAHINQYHHYISSLHSAFSKHLRWIPLIGAIEDALPHYLEIAADNSARKLSGTPALAGALLVLAESSQTATSKWNEIDPHGAIFHATGHAMSASPNRIDNLINRGHTRDRRWPLLTIASYISILGIASTLIHGPYLAAALSGCM